MTQDQTAASKDERELITFFVGEQEFCMDIMLVREIRGWTNATPLPHAPGDVLGVMNLRGAVVPIVDLSARLGFGICETQERNVIVIAAIGGQTVGLLVSSVSDIVGVGRDEVQPLPQISEAQAGAFVEGIIATQNRTLRVLSVDAIGTRFMEERAAG